MCGPTGTLGTAGGLVVARSAGTVLQSRVSLQPIHSQPPPPPNPPPPTRPPPLPRRTGEEVGGARTRGADVLRACGVAYPQQRRGLGYLRKNKMLPIGR